MSPLFCLVDLYLASLTFRSFRLNCKVLNFVTYHTSRLPDIPSVCLWLLLSQSPRSRATPPFFSLPLLPIARSFLVSLLLSFPLAYNAVTIRAPVRWHLLIASLLIFTLLFIVTFVQRKQSLTPAIIHSSCLKGGKLWHFPLALKSSIIVTVIIVVASSLAVGTCYSTTRIKHVCLKLFFVAIFFICPSVQSLLVVHKFYIVLRGSFFSFVEYALLFATLISIGGVSNIRAGQLLKVTANIMLVF